MTNVLTTKNLRVSYGAVEALSDLSFKVKAGDYLALAGPNGAGKSTLIKALLGLAGETAGEVKLFGRELNRFKDWQKVGYLPQTSAYLNPLFPATVKEVVALALLSGQNYPKKISGASRQKIKQALELLDLTALKDRPFNELSGGQKQRTLLARAVANEPELLILDEPGTALDPQSRENFFALTKKLNQQNQTTIILITHDLGFIGNYAKTLLYLDKKIVFYGGFGDFCHSPAMTRYFGPETQHLICHQHH